jgi:bifunctional non-homologous end joining protein LigD
MARESKLPKRLQPMLATLADAPFDDPTWAFETKWDGFRMVACIEGGKVTLYSRNGKIISDSYQPVAKALEKVKQDAVIDGELVALDAQGISRFQLLQNALRAEATLLYCVFDLMFLAHEDLRGLPLIERKERLRRVLPKHPLLSFSEHFPEHGTKFFKQAQKTGLEGIMAKRADSLYRSGARSTDWLKIKTARRQEVVSSGSPRRAGRAPVSVPWCSPFAKIRPGATSAMSAPASAAPLSKSFIAGYGRSARSRLRSVSASRTQQSPHG